MTDTQWPMVNQEKGKKYTTQLSLLDVSIHNQLLFPQYSRPKLEYESLTETAKVNILS